MAGTIILKCVLPLVLLASTTSAQAFPSIPSCGMPCFISALTSDGCGLKDFACHCADTKIQAGITQCVETDCSATDQKSEAFPAAAEAPAPPDPLLTSFASHRRHHLEHLCQRRSSHHHSWCHVRRWWRCSCRSCCRRRSQCCGWHCAQGPSLQRTSFRTCRLSGFLPKSLRLVWVSIGRAGW